MIKMSAEDDRITHDDEDATEEPRVKEEEEEDENGDGNHHPALGNLQEEEEGDVVVKNEEEEEADRDQLNDSSTSPVSTTCFSPGSSSASAFSPVGSSSSSSHPGGLFQPFLNNVNHDNNNTVKSSLAFSIENILKPTFGQRLLWHHVAVATLAARQQQQWRSRQTDIRQGQVNTIKPDPEQDERKQEVSRPKSSLNVVHHHHQQPVDLSAKSDTVKDNGDVPPGMVRGPNGQLWPAWVFCTRYSDRPSSGPRSRKIKKPSSERREKAEKRPRTAFSTEQLSRLRREFEENRYLTEDRRKNLSDELGLNENQIKIWFQNKRAKLKKSSGQRGELAQMLAAQGLYNHSTIPVDDEDNPLY